MGINTAEYIQLAFFALIAVCILAIFNKKQVVQNIEADSGLTGWLYPAAFCVIYVFGYFFYTSFNLIESIFILDANQSYFDSGSDAYGGVAATYMQAELLVNAAIALCISYLVYAFINKRKNFRKLFVIIHAVVLGYLMSAQIIWAFIPDFAHFNVAAMFEIGVVALGAVIWMPYMLKSKRLATIFVN